MRRPIVFLCATMFALRIAASTAQAQVPGYAVPYAPEPPYLSVAEQLFSAHQPEYSAFKRPPAAIGTFTFDFMLLRRSHVDPFDLVTIDTVLVQDAADFGFGPSGAIRFTVEIPSPCGVDLQFSYLSSHEFFETRSYFGTAVRDTLFSQEYISTGVEITHEAPLDSFELNLRAHQWERFAPLVGLRLVTLDEASYHRDPRDGDTDLGRTRNRMAGIQFGGQWLVGQVGRWRLEAVLKTGLYYNSMSVEGFSDFGNFVRKFSTTSFLGEVNAMVVYEFTSNARLRMGYQGMWMEGAALLYDQFDNIEFPNGNGSVDLGSVNFQGGYLGFDITW